MPRKPKLFTPEPEGKPKAPPARPIERVFFNDPEGLVHFDRVRQDTSNDANAWIALDLETGGLSPFRDPIAVVALASADGVAGVWHVRGRLPGYLHTWLADPTHAYITHNGVGFDMQFLAQAGVDIYGPSWYDTMIGELCTLVSGRRDVSVSLKASVGRRLSKVLNKDIDHSSWMNPYLTDEQMAYVVGDIHYLHKLRQKQLDEAGKDSRIRAIELEMAIAPVVARMAINGIPVDLGRLGSYLDGQEETRARLELSLKDSLNVVNLNSPAQLKKALAERGIQVASTSVKAIGSLVYDLTLSPELRGLFKDILDYRHANQRLKMYTTEWINDKVIDGRVHPHFWQVGTDTGRFSASDPNLQQIPRNMRYVFGGTGNDLGKVDFSQLEIRVAAALANDTALKAALDTGDVHLSTAAAIFGIPEAEVTKNQRFLAKAANFTLLFGGGAGLLADYTAREGGTLSYEQAQDMVRGFFQRYRGLGAMKAKAEAMAARRAPAEIVFPSGLRRQLVGQNLRTTTLLNSAVQGTAAAGLKYALLGAQEAGLDKYLLATVHDELVAEVPPDESKDYFEALRAGMVKAMEATVDATITADISVGSHWGKASDQ